MKDNIKYSFKDLVLIRKFYGDVSIDVLISSLKYMIKNKLITKKQSGIISDFSEARFLAQQKELLILKEQFLKHRDIMGHLKFAQIITTPEIAQTILFKNNNTDVTTRSFSTFEAAKNWINNG